jgi:hypothetical protein
MEEDIIEFRKRIALLVEILEDVSNSAQMIPNTEEALLTRKFQSLLESLEGVRIDLKFSNEMLEDISARWSRR